MLDTADRRNLTVLMARLADGDRAAFDGVYSVLWPVVSAFCAKALPPTDAEDAAQAVLLKVFEHAPSFDRNRDALTWALAIAVWETRTIRQRYARSKTTESDDYDPESPQQSPEGLIVERQVLEAAQAAMGLLSASDQETLMATFNEESSDAVSGATFRKRRQRALFRLKEAWRSIYGN